ncbi:hypothetical protein [Paraferrimonas haliotis]|uniref:Uncharacterized protein n=1 Tax=Paraferrimonas haliotis TaxID=2013866 RepID=A0AA37TMV3_9GAMM|nr:hypothetical protein [Paraferrimonas haliotis]GLS82380.1 hypothetical protein GCM10007894_03570 [Paraferrimonas haliotis]
MKSGLLVFVPIWAALFSGTTFADTTIYSCSLCDTETKALVIAKLAARDLSCENVLSDKPAQHVCESDGKILIVASSEHQQAWKFRVNKTVFLSPDGSPSTPFVSATQLPLSNDDYDGVEYFYDIDQRFREAASSVAIPFSSPPI